LKDRRNKKPFSENYGMGEAIKARERRKLKREKSYKGNGYCSNNICTGNGLSIFKNILIVCVLLRSLLEWFGKIDDIKQKLIRMR
jgi:hypothetical protein